MTSVSNRDPLLNLFDDEDPGSFFVLTFCTRDLKSVFITHFFYKI